MPGLPSGTVTFLFTDVEGSTRLWELVPERMRGALRRHDELVRSSIEAYDGYVFSTAGDAFAAAFARPSAAVAAALSAQSSLGAESWELPQPIRVRMGLHVGVADERDGDYFGPVLNRAARIMAAAHGGQVLCSAAFAALVGGQQPAMSLGEHRLKDLAAAEQLFQLGTGSFPPPRTLGSRRTNLPVQANDLVGRGKEVAAVVALVGAHRVVSVIGVGGSGKTRLSLAVAAELVDDFPDGVFFASLAAISDPALLTSFVAEAVGCSAGAGDPMTLATFIARRRVLVVLDNCEHVIDAAAELVEDVVAAGVLGRVLVTSREALDVPGEHVVPLGSLHATSSGGAAVQLLVERARSVRPDFALDDAVLSVLVDVCQQLDGLPLALELAAAQLAHLSPAELAARLHDRFRLLVGRRSRRVSRQQTLQAMMDWSWELLDDVERDVLVQLSVFADGWDLAAAEGVCETPDGSIVASVLRSLVAKSLVVADTSRSRTRYRMLETVRLYSQQKLEDAGRTARCRDRHADWFCAVADAVGAGDRWLDLAGAQRWFGESQNIQAVLEWRRAQGRVREVAALVTLPAVLWRFTPVEQHTQWIDELLDVELPVRARALALVAGAEQAWGQGAIALMGTRAHEAAALARSCGDDELVASALILEGITLQARAPDRAEAVFADAAAHAAKAGHARLESAAWAMAAGLESLGRNRPDAARALVVRAMPHTHALGFERRVAEASISTLEIMEGNWQAAWPAWERTQGALVELGVRPGWTGVVEEAVLRAECGTTRLSSPLQVAVDELRATGGSLVRPDLLTIPLGEACRAEDWERAATIVVSVRRAARTGLSLSTPMTTAYYLRYRSLIPPDELDPDLAVDLGDLIEWELERERNGAVGTD